MSIVIAKVLPGLTPAPINRIHAVSHQSMKRRVRPVPHACHQTIVAARRSGPAVPPPNRIYQTGEHDGRDRTAVITNKSVVASREESPRFCRSLAHGSGSEPADTIENDLSIGGKEAVRPNVARLLQAAFSQTAKALRIVVPSQYTDGLWCAAIKYPSGLEHRRRQRLAVTRDATFQHEVEQQRVVTAYLRKHLGLLLSKVATLYHRT